MLLVLVEPVVGIFWEELVLAKAGIYQAVDEGSGEVLTSRIDMGSSDAGPC